MMNELVETVDARAAAALEQQPAVVPAARTGPDQKAIENPAQPALLRQLWCCELPIAGRTSAEHAPALFGTLARAA